MITIYSEKEEARNNAMPSHSNNSVATESVIPGSLKGMSELVKKNLESVKKINWQKEGMKQQSLISSVWHQKKKQESR